MKLIQEIIGYQKLREDLNNVATAKYTVYKVTGPNTEKTYYGYVKGGEEQMRNEFFGRTKSGESGNPEDDKRGINLMINANGGSNDLEFEVLDEPESEEQAFMARNEERGADPNSTTGPSYFPPHIHRSVNINHPEHGAKMATQREFNKLKTAREAWAAKYFDTAKMKAASVNPMAKQEMMKDLDVLSPRDFAKKYNLPIEGLA